MLSICGNCWTCVLFGDCWKACTDDLMKLVHRHTYNMKKEMKAKPCLILNLAFNGTSLHTSRPLLDLLLLLDYFTEVLF